MKLTKDQIQTVEQDKSNALIDHDFQENWVIRGNTDQSKRKVGEKKRGLVVQPRFKMTFHGRNILQIVICTKSGIEQYVDRYVHVDHLI